MVTIVVLVDQLFWRPVVAWSQRFKFEQTDSGQEPTSAVFDLLRHSSATAWLNRRMFVPIGQSLDVLFSRSERLSHAPRFSSVLRRGSQVLLLAILALVVDGLVRGVVAIRSELTWREALHVNYLAFLTFVRVAVMVVTATLIWTPIGVRIGFSPRLARIAQPLVQIGASFPANLIFPVVVLIFLRFHVNFEGGSVLLMSLGTQWYILFNVIAGASSVPGDLREEAAPEGGL